MDGGTRRLSAQLTRLMRLYWAGVGRIAEQHVVPSQPRWIQEIEEFVREAA
jgi:hypothetical protein